jgi:hypothetical protein
VPSATGQAKHCDKFGPLVPGFRFVAYADLSASAQALDAEAAPVIVEPIQGEGGVRIPSVGYLGGISRSCRANGSLGISRRPAHAMRGALPASHVQAVLASSVSVTQRTGADHVRHP